MNAIRTILTEQSRIVPLLTLTLMLWVIGGTSTQLSNNEASAQEQSIPEDTEPNPITTVSSFQEAVIPISKIHILFVYHFIREWVLVEEDNSVSVSDLPLPPSRLLLTLFRQIISPNAP